MQIKVYSRAISDNVTSNIIRKIKSRKGLENADDSLVAEKVIDFLKKNSRALKKIAGAEDFREIAKSKEVDAVAKYARAELRPVYGLFVEKNLSTIKGLLKDEAAHIRDILMMHKSSKERVDFYEEFYKKIFDVTGKPNSIIDIACGLNPMSFETMGLMKETRYIALELNQNDADIINDFFRGWKINGEAFRHDITKEPIEYKADAAFAFKIFDIIDTKVTERIIKELDVNWIAASFSTKTVSRKDMRFKRRAGFQKMLRRLGMKYQTLEFPNEIVYVIRK